MLDFGRTTLVILRPRHEFLGQFQHNQLALLQETFKNLSADHQKQIIAAIQQGLSDDFTREQLLNVGSWDVLGVRVGGGAAAGVGVEGTFDFIWNFNSLEFSIMFNLNGLLGADGGASYYLGLFLGFNANDNSAYSGWGTGLSTTATIGGGVAAQLDVSGRILGLTDAWRVKGQPIGAYAKNDTYNLALLIAPGVRAGASYSAGYTWEVYSYAK